MYKETIATGKTVEEAVAAGASELQKPVDRVKFEIIEEARKGILGIGAADAKIKVYVENTPADIALDFIETLIKNMEVDATVTIDRQDNERASISVTGDNLGLLIGRHGDVLDSIQYLTTLAANKSSDEFYRITLDIENYREKRAKTLKALARRMSEKVLRYKKSFSLEPMNAYERRIVHSECQSITGVTTYSVGDGTDRKIIIAPEGKIAHQDKEKS